MLEWLPFKEKSLKVFNDFSKERPSIIVLEGAIRSGKTLTSIALFWNYVMTNSGENYLMAGYSLGSLTTNVVDGEFGFIAFSKLMNTPFEKKTDREGNMYLAYKNKKIKLVGADNRQSPKRIRGMSIEGLYIDEVNIIHKDFFSMAIGRCSATSDKLILVTLNPDVPTHWFYANYLDNWDAYGFPGGYKYYHFVPSDNPAMTKEKYFGLRSMFKGFELERFVFGKRVRTDGAIYRFSRERHIIEEDDDILSKLKYFDIGVDIGKSESPTVYSLVGYTFGYNDTVVLEEFYDKDNIDVDVVVDNLKAFVDKYKIRYPQIADCFVDSAEPLMIKQFKKNIFKVNVKKSKKEPIKDRIKITNQLMNVNRFKVKSNCTHTINALTNAIYDDKGIRLDDGSYEVDCLDAMEYCMEQHFKEIIERLSVI